MRTRSCPGRVGFREITRPSFCHSMLSEPSITKYFNMAKQSKPNSLSRLGGVLAVTKYVTASKLPNRKSIVFSENGAVSRKGIYFSSVRDELPSHLVLRRSLQGPAERALLHLFAPLTQGRSGQGSSPCSKRPQNHARTPSRRRWTHKLPPGLGVGS